MQKTGGKVVASRQENILGYSCYIYSILQYALLPAFCYFFIAQNLDPGYSFRFLFPKTGKIDTLLFPVIRYLITYMQYACGIRWGIFCVTILLITLIMGVKYLQLIWQMQSHLKTEILYRGLVDSMVHRHHIVSITCYNWSYNLGNLIAALMIGAACYWGVVDFLVIYIENIPREGLSILVVSSLLVKLVYTFLVERASQAYATSELVISKMLKGSASSKYCRRLVKAERSARIAVPCFYFCKAMKIHLLKIPVEITLNFLCTFGQS